MLAQSLKYCAVVYHTSRVADMRSETYQLRKEREAIEREKQQLLQRQRELREAGPRSDSSRGDHQSSSRSRHDIIPGANSLEDVEAFLDAKKREKKTEMRERNKDFVRGRKW